MHSASANRLALVTGGGGGLGREFCLELARRGWYVAVSDREPTHAERTWKEIESTGGAGEWAELDVTEPTAWDRLRHDLRSRWSRLDLLVNNAGVCTAGLVGDDPLDDFHRVMEVNLLGVVHGCHTMVPWLKETAPGGSIVNIASIAAALNAPAMAAYSTSKAGVLAYSETLYAELRRHAVGVTVVLPGFFASDLLSRTHFPDELYRRVAEYYVRTASFSSGDVVQQTLRAVDRRRLHVVLGRRARLAWHLKRLAPEWFQRLVAWKFARDCRFLTPPD